MEPEIKLCLRAQKCPRDIACSPWVPIIQVCTRLILLVTKYRDHHNIIDRGIPLLMQHVEQAIQDKAAMEFILNTESERVEESIKSFLRSDLEDNWHHDLHNGFLGDCRHTIINCMGDRWSLIKFQNELYCNSGVAKTLSHLKSLVLCLNRTN